MKYKEQEVNEWVLAIKVYSLVRHARRVAGLTQKELADRCGIAQEAVARLESAKHTSSLPTLIKVATALGKRVEIRFKKL